MARFACARAVMAMLAAGGPVLTQIPFQVPVGPVLVDPLSPDNLYAGTDHGLLRSTDGGATWTQVPILTLGMEQPAVSTLATDSDDPPSLYAGTALSSGGVWKSVRRGTSWQKAAAGLPPTGGTVTRILPVPGKTWLVYAVVTTSSYASALYKSSDSGATWIHKTTVQGRLTVHLADPRILYYARAFKVFRSTDEGVNWSEAGTVRPSDPGDLSGAQVEVSPVDPSRLYASSTGNYSGYNGIFVSSNSGATWVRTWEGNCIGVWINPYRANEIYVGDSAGGPGYIRSVNGGGGWLEGSITTQGWGAHFAFHPREANTLFAGTSGTNGGGVYRTTNAGSNWTRIGAFRPSVAATPFGAAGRFLTDAGAPGTLPLTIRAAEKPDEQMPFTVSTTGEGWVSLNRAGGVTGDSILVTFDPTGLPEGEHRGTIRISCPTAFNATQDLPVSLTVVSAPQESFLLAGTYRNLVTRSPGGLAFDADGNLYVSDRSSHTVRRIDRLGSSVVIAGTGESGLSGDGGPAGQAQLSSPSALAADRDGSLYVIDQLATIIRKISGGTITTVAGSRTGETRPIEGALATSFRFSTIRGLAADGSGNFYFATLDRIWRVAPTGRLNSYAGGGWERLEGTSASSWEVRPDDIAFDGQGNLYFTESGRHAVRKIDRNRTVTTLAGAGDAGYSGDGGPAVSALLNTPTRLAADSAGNVFVWDSSNRRVRRIGADGRIRTVAGNGLNGEPSPCTPAPLAALEGPRSMAVDTAGNLVLAESVHGRLLEVWMPAAGSDVRPAISDPGVVNAASYRPGVAPGAIITIQGANLASATELARTAEWPLVLGNARLCAGQSPVPLYYASPTQISGQMPYTARPGSSRVFVYAPGGGVAAAANVLSAAPGLFVYGESRAVVVNQNGRVNAAGEPAEPGSAIVAYLTGQGEPNNPVPTGLPAPVVPLSSPKASVRATLGDKELTVLFLGLTPGMVGLTQANLMVPEDLPPGDYPLTITIGEASSNSALVRVGWP